MANPKRLGNKTPTSLSFPPREFIGKSLKELNLRARYNVHIVAIHEIIPENFRLVPPPEFVIKDSDILIMLGRSEDIRHIKALK